MRIGRAIAFAALAITLRPSLIGAAGPFGTVQIVAYHESGMPAGKIPVYIHGVQGTRFTGGGFLGKEGHILYRLPPGRYRVQAAVCIPCKGDYERYASPEAYIEVRAGDHVPILLRLQALHRQA